ncbi:hypothetical protein Gpo141_00012221 [Globisporangium polare]
MLGRRVPTRSQGVSNGALSLGDDDDEFELFQTAPSPWAEAGEGLEPHPPPSKPRSPPERNPSRRQLVPASAVVTAPGGGQTSIRVALNTGKPFRPATNAMMPSRGSAGKFLPLMPAPPNVQSPRQASSPSKQLQRGRDASSLVNAYQSLVEQSNAMTVSYEESSERRRLHETALKLGIAQLSDERVRRQKQHIRFNTLKNEVDIFQQYLDPFIFEMRTPHEHQVNSSVYRHFARMQGVQEMGIPIYSLGNYMEEEFDRILTARTQQKFYHRIRRRDAAHYMDTELIPRPAAAGSAKRASILLSATPVTGSSSS